MPTTKNNTLTVGLASLASLVLMAVPGDAAPRDNKNKPGEKREMLSLHKTVAKFSGIASRRCMGLTTLCPDNCGHSGEFATFDIIAYLAYEKPGQYGDPKAESYMFQIEDNRKKLKVASELAQQVRELKQGDFVLLDWQHDYVTKTDGGGSVSSPERTVTKLQKITKDEADALTRKAASQPSRP
jgi:hypothetical protein